jgi:hypothetical protein
VQDSTFVVYNTPIISAEVVIHKECVWIFSISSQVNKCCVGENNSCLPQEFKIDGQSEEPIGMYGGRLESSFMLDCESFVNTAMWGDVFKVLESNSGLTLEPLVSAMRFKSGRKKKQSVH